MLFFLELSHRIHPKHLATTKVACLHPTDDLQPCNDLWDRYSTEEKQKDPGYLTTHQLELIKVDAVTDTTFTIDATPTLTSHECVLQCEDITIGYNKIRKVLITDSLIRVGAHMTIEVPPTVTETHPEVLKAGYTFTGVNGAAGSITLETVESVSLSFIGSLGIDLKDVKEVKLELFDTQAEVIDALPPNLKLKDTATFVLALNHLSDSQAHLEFDQNTLIWGKTRVTIPTKYSVEVEVSNAIVTAKQTPRGYTLKSDKCILDTSFTTALAPFLTIDGDIYVADPAQPPQFVGSPVTAKKYIAYCVTSDTAPLGCPESLFIDASRKGTILATAIAAPSANELAVVLLTGNCEIDQTFANQFSNAQYVLVLDKAKSLKVTGFSGSVNQWNYIPLSLIPVTLEGASSFTLKKVSPMLPDVFQSSPNLIVENPQLVLSSSLKQKSYDISTQLAGTKLTISSFITGDSAFVETPDSITIDGITIKLPVAVTDVKIQYNTAKKVNVVNNNPNSSTRKISIKGEGPSIICSFGDSWSTVTHTLYSVGGNEPTIQTKGKVAPTFLTISSMKGASFVDFPPPPPPSDPSSGLPAWAIALIVIGSVVVVAGIVLGVLNGVGVLHWCNKKPKVEV